MNHVGVAGPGCYQVAAAPPPPRRVRGIRCVRGTEQLARMRGPEKSLRVARRCNSGVGPDVLDGEGSTAVRESGRCGECHWWACRVTGGAGVGAAHTRGAGREDAWLLARGVWKDELHARAGGS